MPGFFSPRTLFVGCAFALGLAATIGILLSQRDGPERVSIASVLAGPRAETGVVELAGETLAGADFDIAALRGTPVFINVWASW